MTAASNNSLRNQLQKSVEKLELEIIHSNLPNPTPQMCEFLIAGEDHRFHYHPGVDPIALCRATWKTVFRGSRQGASTIAMQLVRTITGRYEKTWRRKLVEIFLAIYLSKYVSKDRLPILYLSVAYYGWGMNNFGQACSRLGIDPRTVSTFEAAKLVARIKYPEPKKLAAGRSKRIHQRAVHLMTLAGRADEIPHFLL